MEKKKTQNTFTSFSDLLRNFFFMCLTRVICLVSCLVIFSFFFVCMFDLMFFCLFLLLFLLSETVFVTFGHSSISLLSFLGSKNNKVPHRKVAMNNSICLFFLCMSFCNCSCILETWHFVLKQTVPRGPLTFLGRFTLNQVPGGSLHVLLMCPETSSLYFLFFKIKFTAGKVFK